MDITFVGMNLTSQLIDVAVRPSGERWKTDFVDENIAAMATRLKNIQPELVVMEANGTFELPVAGILATQGLRFALVNPRNIREFARAIGKMSRSDYGQASLLAYFAEIVHPEARQLSEDVVQKLRELRGRREDISQMLQLERHRLRTAAATVQRGVQNHIFFLERSIMALEDEFSRTVRASSVWR
ncbi:MAG TPA: transposase [Terriglobia bacterium]|nr:transposase [Terriglobia bacterium]